MTDKKPIIKLLLICFAFLFCSKNDKSKVSKQDILDFNRLYRASQMGFADSSQIDSLNILSAKLSQLDDSQNELLLQYYSTLNLPYIKNLMYKEFNFDDLDDIYFADINKNTTKFIALVAFKQKDKHPESAAYFALKKEDEWHMKKYYQNITVGVSLDQAKESYFQTLYKDLGYFDDWSNNASDNFWNNSIWNRIVD